MNGDFGNLSYFSCVIGAWDIWFLSKSEAEMSLEEDHIIYLRWLIDGLRLTCSASQNVLGLEFV